MQCSPAGAAAQWHNALRQSTSTSDDPQGNRLSVWGQFGRHNSPTSLTRTISVALSTNECPRSTSVRPIPEVNLQRKQHEIQPWSEGH